MPVVTIAASFGAGGSAVATDIAKRLSWQMFDRAIPFEVARRLSIPLQDALSHDEHRENRTAAVFSQLVRAMIPIAGVPVAIEVLNDTDYKRETEAVIRSLADPLQKAVVLGRGAALILGDEPGALRRRAAARMGRSRVAQVGVITVSISSASRKDESPSSSVDSYPRIEKRAECSTG